ncbi:MAG: aldehyde ferredoxin oxidoreductase C-terminal domain-containing protein [Ignavibacteriales bacterium]
MARVVRVNVGTGTAMGVDLREYDGLGGRGLTSRIVLDEVRPTCDPLGPDNKIVFAPGLLGGTIVSSSGRLSVGAKSPLTGGIKEANAGGAVADQIARLGIAALVVEGSPEPGSGWRMLKVDRCGVAFEACGELAGLGTYETVERIRARFGGKVGIICIGQAGEMQMRAASVAVTDILGEPNRQAARGGLGAVMGSKRIKAIIVDDSGVARRVAHDQEGFQKAATAFNKALFENPKTKSQALYGTASIVKACSSIGTLPTRNFRSGSFEAAEAICGERIYQDCVDRGGEGNPTVACMNGCVIRCGNVYPDPSGKAIVSTVQYETIGLMGSNLGIGSLDDIAFLNKACNDIGLDTIEMGATLGVAAEAGLMSWGDGPGALDLVREVGRGTTLGRVLGQGAVITGAVLGVQRVPAAKGQAFPAYDPRSLKGNGVTYATSPMGADHTAGNAFGSRSEVNQLLAHGQIELSRKLQVLAAVLDSAGLCIFARPPVVADPGVLINLIDRLYGYDWGPAKFEEIGIATLRCELEFNRRAGFTRAHDRLPDYMYREKLPPHDTVFDVSDEEMERVFQF